ncbi:MAG: hypothetical protein ACH0QD_13305 [Tepidibacillus sp.]
MKKYVFLMVVVFVLVLSGCQNETVNQAVDNAKSNIQEKVEAVTGEHTQTDQEKAEEVARAFAKDFFTLSDKKDGSQIGGLQYLHPDLREAFSKQAYGYLYSGLDAVLKNEPNIDRKGFPTVTKTKIQDVEPFENQTKDGIALQGYRMRVIVDFADETTYFNNFLLEVGYLDNVWQITSITPPQTEEEEWLDVEFDN